MFVWSGGDAIPLFKVLSSLTVLGNSFCLFSDEPNRNEYQ